ncbi:MAG TPA: asparagine synthetase B, partial [Bacillota bacterium]|nr:asparagine synthetase B [Bacillota bacterium]
MCGIAGYVDYNGVIAGADEYEEMLDTLRRRGPDDEGSVFYPCAAMLHARLSVVDPENGRQPMLYRERGRDLCLVYNGELYNTEEIRQSLLSKGYTFIGHSDTEVLLKAYAEWGDGCVDRFNGIFAFAVWDNVEGRLFIARDRIGVKPFFYSVTKDGAFVFGSEIKTLLKHPSV